MGFLGNWLRKFSAHPQRVEVPGRVEESELLARFLPDSKMFSSNGVRATAFMPRKGSVSDFRITGMNEAQIRGIGTTVLPVKPPKARGDRRRTRLRYRTSARPRQHARVPRKHHRLASRQREERAEAPRPAACLRVRSEAARLTHSAIASSAAVCSALRPPQKSAIWWRQLKPGATTRSSAAVWRTAGKRTRSPHAWLTS